LKYVGVFLELLQLAFVVAVFFVWWPLGIVVFTMWIIFTAGFFTAIFDLSEHVDDAGE
jgi:hypothetical protein